MAAAFQLSGAEVRYGDRLVLSGVNLLVAEGQRVALIGKSGAGKSTLLKLMFEQRRDSALVPQDLGLVRTLSVFHNVYMGRLHRHPGWYNLLNLALPRRKEIAAVGTLVDRLGMSEKLFAPVGELSGGQQQRTAVARALYRGSDTFIGDEPVSAVDAEQSRSLLGAIVAAHRTVVVALHDVALALAFSDRIVGLRDGRITLDEPSVGLKPEDLAPVYQA
jgi:phosphonate transport system ATP-binding protein